MRLTTCAAGMLVLAACGAATSSAQFPAVGAPIPTFSVERWVNSPPLTPVGLQGKVVLVDFWEYTCVNCIRTLPFVKAWHERYAQAGLVVVGVHAPEFDFGKRAENIDRGIRDHGLAYPIAIDNDFTTWKAFHNTVWPTKYLFDAHGRLRNVWVGEGSYGQIEAKIRQLLREAGLAELPAVTAEVQSYRPSEPGTLSPETHLGSAHPGGLSVARVGAWERREQFIEHADDAPAVVSVDFVGGEVNLVMQPGKRGKASVGVKLDGHPAGTAPGDGVGADGIARTDRAGMVQLVKGAGRGRHRLELETADEGLKLFAFTFGP